MKEIVAEMVLKSKKPRHIKYAIGKNTLYCKKGDLALVVKTNKILMDFGKTEILEAMIYFPKTQKFLIEHSGGPYAQIEHLYEKL